MVRREHITCLFPSKEDEQYYRVIAFEGDTCRLFLHDGKLVDCVIKSIGTKNVTVLVDGIRKRAIPLADIKSYNIYNRGDFARGLTKF